MKEINFYYIEEDINVFLYNFLSKLIEKEKKVIVYSENIEKMEKLDNMLWTIKKTDFLPHLLYNEKGAEYTPILISNTRENKYNFNFLLLSVFVDDINFLNTFEKIFYLFSPINIDAINIIKKNWGIYKGQGFIPKLFKKNKDGKWMENNELIL